MFEWSAESGGSVMNYEAIPDGSYWTSAKEKENRSKSPGDWGVEPTRHSYRLHETPVTALKRITSSSRSGGFALHGGTQPGSAGCIQVGSAGDDKQKDFREFDRMMSSYPGRISVEVSKTP